MFHDFSGFLQEIPRCTNGEELWQRFHWFGISKDPLDCPVAEALLKAGIDVQPCLFELDQEVAPQQGCSVFMKNLKILFRQPTYHDLLIYYVERLESQRSMRSVLWGLVEFLTACRQTCPEIEYVGGWVNKLSGKGEDQLNATRLVDFYARCLGDVCLYEQTFRGCLWIFARFHDSERWTKNPIWRKRNIITGSTPEM